MPSRQRMRTFIESTVLTGVAVSEIALFESQRNSINLHATHSDFGAQSYVSFIFFFRCGCLQSDRMHNSAQDSYLPAHSENLVVFFVWPPSSRGFARNHRFSGPLAYQNSGSVKHPELSKHFCEQNTSSLQGIVHDNLPFAMNFWYRLGYE